MAGLDPHLHGQQPDAFDGRERLFSGQRGRGGVLRPSQAGVLPQAQLRGRLDGRVHQHAGRLHGLVPGQADQDGVRHGHHGSSTRARSCGMIGGDGINDESNKTAPAPAHYGEKGYFDIYDYAWHTEQVCKEPVPPNLL